MNNNTTTKNNTPVWSTEQMMIIIQKAEELSPILGMSVSDIVRSLLDNRTPDDVKVMISHDVPVTQKTPILVDDEVTEEIQGH